MPLLALVFVLLLPFVVIALMPLSLLQRYRVGTSRRLARGWVATLNMAGVLVSATLFLLGAAVTSAWVPNAFTYSLAGMAGGVALGLVGLVLTRWETTPRTLHYTPNRWLVLGIVLIVTSRLAYGLWRSWNAWVSTSGDASWIAASGAAGSLAAGAVVLGYYATYWAGLRSRIRSRAESW